MESKMDHVSAVPQRHSLNGRPAIRYVKCAAMAVAFIVLARACVLAYPQPLFSNHTVYQNYEIWSDQPIAPHITQVLDDATRRLRTSELYDPERKIRVFFCNASWRIQLLFHSKAGGQTYTWLTPNVFIRASDIASNRIYSPGPGPISDAEHRPLSYFIAHETTHAMEASAFGQLMELRYPTWLVEGYADYVGKGGDFDFDENRRLLVGGSPLLDFQRSVLYRGYELEVFYLLNKKGLTVMQVFANPPRERDLLELLRSNSTL